ncbi:HD domain-containing protein 2 [Fukomys damarensis]|uniref:5'-deoxynucleotidase HDDC2 n=1 Tax=Fukomys damarensis TaxID=885580 RepID=A0A091DKE9_FUKDA|nr:HD domain-containing protein 2 [Fukomys damarensis]
MGTLQAEAAEGKEAEDSSPWLGHLLPWDSQEQAAWEQIWILPYNRENSVPLIPILRERLRGPFRPTAQDEIQKPGAGQRLVLITAVFGGRRRVRCNWNALISNDSSVDGSVGFREMMGGEQNTVTEKKSSKTNPDSSAEPPGFCKDDVLLFKPTVLQNKHTESTNRPSGNKQEPSALPCMAAQSLHQRFTPSSQSPSGLAGVFPSARPIFLSTTCRSKRVPRTGWVYRNVENPESVSDHMYRMALMAMVTRDDRLNRDRCIRLALVHDMAECIVGDIAPADNIPKEEKHRREEEAMKQITQLLPEDLSKELYDLWEEYETQSSAEARFVKQLDQCEMILQASEYEDLERRPGRLQDFFNSTAGKFSHPEIVQLVSELEEERNANIAVARGAAEPLSPGPC